MYVLVTDESPAQVREADDFRRLHLSAPGLDRPAIADALKTAGLGQLVDEDNAQLDVAALRAAVAQAATVPDWETQWDAMIGYAASKGWLSEDGRLVGVHITRD